MNELPFDNGSQVGSSLYPVEREPHLMLRLAENALSVAQDVRDTYIKNTSFFVVALRAAMREAALGRRDTPILDVARVDDLAWTHLHGELATFVDGGIGQVRAAGRVPLLVRVGSYTVRCGERDLQRREEFGYYPLILGDLEGGSKDRANFPDIVRITAELLGGLAALERHPDLGVLMFHGPLLYAMDTFAGHTPFTERDIDIFLARYALDSRMARDLKERFLSEARHQIYPHLTPHARDWSDQRVFEPLSWLAFLYRRLIATAQRRTPVPVIASVVERGSTMRDFCATVLLRRVFDGLRAKGHGGYFNRLYGRTDLTSPRAVLDKLGYTDTLLLSMLLEPGYRTESWVRQKFGGLQRVEIALPRSDMITTADVTALRDPAIGFPIIRSCYVRASQTTEPIRVEMFDALGEEQLHEAARRAYLYARLLPGYGFPVSLDIVDKYARVPAWLSDAYGKLIRYHLASSLPAGELADAEARRFIVQTLYLSHRDWLFRPHVR